MPTHTGINLIDMVVSYIHLHYNRQLSAEHMLHCTISVLTSLERARDES